MKAKLHNPVLTLSTRFGRAKAKWFLFSVFALQVSPAQAGLCDRLMAAVGIEARPAIPAEAKTRADILAAAVNAGVPVMTKNIGGNDIPVLLMNAESYPKLKNLLANSLGTDIQLQPTHGNDHGIMRVGLNLIDVDTPGARSVGELNRTGISWRGLDAYMPRRKDSSSVIMEVLYPLDEQQMKTVSYYQRVRRAAIFRVPFTFKQNAMPTGNPNTLTTGGEHCFLFCKGTMIDSHLVEIKKNLAVAGVKDPRKLLATPGVAKFIAESEQKIVEFLQDNLNPKMLGKLAIPPELEVLPEFQALSAEGKLETLNYLVGYDASEKYQRVIQALGVTSDMSVNDAASAKAGAILIYDSPAKTPLVQNGTYTAKGNFMTWDTHGQKAVVHPDELPRRHNGYKNNGN